MDIKNKNRSQLPYGFAKPRTCSLHAGVPGNYGPCRFRGTRQNVYEISVATIFVW